MVRAVAWLPITGSVARKAAALDAAVQTRTTHARGLRWMMNETVHLLATRRGALLAPRRGGLVP